jgi:hypothetical protein
MDLPVARALQEAPAIKHFRRVRFDEMACLSGAPASVTTK